MGIYVLDKAPPDPYKKSRTRPLVHFPIELKLPEPITLPPIEQRGRGRPNALNTDIARRMLAVACTGATVSVIAGAGGVNVSTLREWLTRDDHDAYEIFQRAFAQAETYATLAAMKSIMENMHTDPKVAFEFLARRYPADWGKVAGQDGVAPQEGNTVYNLPGIKGDLNAMFERIAARMTQGKATGPLSLEAGTDGVHRPKDPRPPREKKP